MKEPRRWQYRSSRAVSSRSLLSQLHPEAYELCAAATAGGETPLGRSKLSLLEQVAIAWPPNLFAFTSVVLGVTGGYAWPTTPGWIDRAWMHLRRKCSFERELPAEWTAAVWAVVCEWRKGLSAFSKSPSDFRLLRECDGKFWARIATSTPRPVRRVWQRVCESMQTRKRGDVQDIWRDPKTSRHTNYVAGLLFLHAIADGVCVGWGIERRGDTSLELHFPVGAAIYAENELLARHGTLATVQPDRGRVLPKRRTPETGVTLRSLSLNLGFHRSSVNVQWAVGHPDLLRPVASWPTEKSKLRKARQFETMSILLVPWPLKIESSAFAPCIESFAPRIDRDDEDVSRLRFQYRPKERVKETQSDFDALLRAAEARGPIDLVLFPEAALTEREARAVAQCVKSYASRRALRSPTQLQATREAAPPRSGVGLLAGVRGVREGVAFNRVDFWIAPVDATRGNRSAGIVKVAEQSKHHPWKLNRSQIQTYHLGGQLHFSYDWWEDLEIRRRSVTFVNCGERITVCPLICEDLARQDPIADLVRTVGPSLVIAILLDGPQIGSRWGARYASVLADDPGSAVLTLTALGMSARSSSGQPGTRSGREVAMWSDHLGHGRELTLSEGSQGLLLHLAAEQDREHTLDGRSEYWGSRVLTFGGVEQIKIAR